MEMKKKNLNRKLFESKNRRIDYEDSSNETNNFLIATLPRPPRKQCCECIGNELPQRQIACHANDLHSKRILD